MAQAIAVKLTERTFHESVSGAYDKLQESRLIVEAGGDLGAAKELVKEAERTLLHIRPNAKSGIERAHLHMGFEDTARARVRIAQAHNAR